MFGCLRDPSSTIRLPRSFLQVPRAQAQPIFAAEGPHLLEQLLDIATNEIVPLPHTSTPAVCRPFGQVLVGRQRIPVSYPSLDDTVLLSPREHISDYSCDVCEHRTTFQITYPQRTPLIDCQTLSLKIAQDYQVLPILQYIFQKIKKHQRNSEIGKQWLNFYHHIYQYILTFTDYLEYLSWHYQTFVDDVFTSGIMSIADILRNDQNTKTRWNYRLSAEIDVRSSSLIIRNFRFVISPASVAREASVILSRYSPSQDTIVRTPLAACDLIKYSRVIVSTDAETISQFRQELRSLCDRYNTSRAQHTAEIDATRQQLILLRSSVKHSHRVSNIDKISLTGLISKYVTRLYNVHRISSASRIPDIREFFLPLNIETDQSDYCIVSSSRTFDLKGD